MRGLFVTGTGTGVGKTVLSATIAAAIAATGEPVRAFKPVLTGVAPPPAGDQSGAWPADHELLAAVLGMSAEEVAPLRFAPAVSPHLAAQLAGTAIEPANLLAAARASGAEATLIVEGVGGLLVPLHERYSVCDLAADLGLPVVVAALPGLGTINHTLLTLRAARAAGLDVRAVVLTPWPDPPTLLERSNRDTIARLGEVEVATLGTVERPDRATLARHGGHLPWAAWVAGSEDG
jgi:dethiobiotin synthetase